MMRYEGLSTCCVKVTPSDHAEIIDISMKVLPSLLYYAVFSTYSIVYLIFCGATKMECQECMAGSKPNGQVHRKESWRNLFNH